MKAILDAQGRPMFSTIREQRGKLTYAQAERMALRAKFDAAQTVSSNERHWANADNLDPHQAASLNVRRRLRSRSRYEVIENNPYLKGTLLTIASDFVKTGPRLNIIDPDISKEVKQNIELLFYQWARKIKLRRKLWRMRMAKIVDGESFMRAYTDFRLNSPVKLNFQVIECDRVSSQFDIPNKLPTSYGEVDGVRFDDYEEPVSYHVLKQHPGGSNSYNYIRNLNEGQWIDVKYVIHWFRQDRGWLRGIPELTPSLPLCALLRRYTLAVVEHAEVAADLTALIESEGPPSVDAWDSEDDEAFDLFPIERGQIMKLPWGNKITQLDAVPLGQQYDAFVGALLREITRPVLVPFNISSGTSKDANMASAVVDAHIYKDGQLYERTDCEEEVIDKVANLWWEEALLLNNYLGNAIRGNSKYRFEMPRHEWRWDKIGLDHTDPTKIANAIKTGIDTGVLTDRDIQEGYHNRDVDDWRKEKEEDIAFRKKVGLIPEKPEPTATLPKPKVKPKR